MTTRLLTGTVVAIALAAWACNGGTQYANSGPSSPTPSPTPGPTPGGPAGSTITILGNQGAQSFTPNPGSASSGTTIAWTNTDNVTHHIVMNDGSLDTGEIRPGQSSPTLTMGSDGGNYHCTIHPGMVGSIRASNGQPPPCQGPYC